MHRHGGIAVTTASIPAPGLDERSLLHTWSLEDGEFDQLLEHAERLAGPAGRQPLLAGARAAALFLAPSLRTRTSFEVACHDLGAHPVVLQPGQGVWGFEHRDDVVMDGGAAEHVREAIPVLGTMTDVLAVRAFAGLQDAALDRSEPVFGAIREAATVPLLNLESATDHPHQGLADALVLRRLGTGAGAGDRGAEAGGPARGRHAKRVVVTWAPHVKPLPRAVPQAAVSALVRDGHDVVLAHPPGFELDATVLADAQAAAGRRGGSLSVTHDRAAALDGADIVYAKSWGSVAHYGDATAGATAVQSQDDWRVATHDLASHTRFMHCLPVRRGVVVDADVLDSPASLVVEQAACRLAVQKASLCRALGVMP